jgi:hypothetical protein
MIAALFAVLFSVALGAPCAAAGRSSRSAAAAPDAQELPQPGEIDGSLIDAVNSIEQPNLVAVFAYMPMANQPSAFAELLTRDHKGLKRYAEKLASDMKSAGGLPAWDHQVCVVLISRFQTAADKSGLPDKKRLSIINECLLSRVISLQEVLLRRKS